MFKEILEEGKVLVRKTWTNTNSTKDQVTVQFIQKKFTKKLVNLVALAQGYKSGTIATTLMSFDRETLLKMGLETDKNYLEENKVVYADDLFGVEVNIQVTENHMKATDTQSPKCNPTTGEVLCLEGLPIFRHTELVPGEVEDVFIQHDKSECRVSIESVGDFAEIGK